VSYRRGIGPSKITGTLSGTVKASAKILWTIGRMAATTHQRAPRLQERVEQFRTDAPAPELEEAN
jgi:hypothetical protein